MIEPRCTLRETGKASAIAFALFAGIATTALAEPIQGGTLDPLAVPKYFAPLVKPPAMVRDGTIKFNVKKNADYYEIAVRQFTQQILPSLQTDGVTPIPPTTVWSYGPNNDPRTVAEGGRYFYPAFTIENKFNKPTVVKWINDLVDADDKPLPHIIPVDPTLHWANPIGEPDTRPDPNITEYWSNKYIDPVSGVYTGPVPMVTHVHGAHTYEQYDGYPEAWYLPAPAYADPAINAPVGTFYKYYDSTYGENWEPGSATFVYPNDQRPTTLWYHDHTLGMTRVNVYAGPAGFYIIRGGPDDTVLDARDGMAAVLPSPRPGPGIDPFGTFYEIPIVIQDRSFNANGDLFYPDNRAFFEGLAPDQLDIPFTPEVTATEAPSDIAPIWLPEFFGNMMVVNGQTWPFLDVEQRQYRFRLLNGCNSRFLILDFNAIPGVKVTQIGAEGGFLAAPVDVTAVNGNRILMSPAERADVIVDFSGVGAGSYVLGNVGPDEPFGGGVPGVDFGVADPDSTGQVMLFNVGPVLNPDPTTPAQFLQLPAIAPLTTTLPPRKVSLNELDSETVFVMEAANGDIVESSTLAGAEPFGPAAALLGAVNPDGTGNPLPWMAAITENPMVGDTETWEIYNYTMDAHPIHIHLIQFQVIDRQVLDANWAPIPMTETGPLPTENGWKDTVICYPGEVTRVRMTFDTPGLYVWHCHIVEHEDNEMMRPYYVGTPAAGFPLSVVP